MICIHLAFRERAILFGSLLGLTMLNSPATMAATATSNIAVNVTVTANCTTTANSTVAFGSVNTTSNTATDRINVLSVSCTTGAPWTASASVGAGSGATFAVRKMTAGSNTLAYSLFTDAGRTTVWGNGLGGTGTLSNVGTDVPQGMLFYGRVFAGQTSVRAGSYSDIVVITVTY